MKKSKSPAEQITAARAVSPRKALALTAAVLAGPPLLPPDAPVQVGQKQNRKARLKSRPDLQLTSLKARSGPMEAKPSKARQPMWMIFMMR